MGVYFSYTSHALVEILKYELPPTILFHTEHFYMNLVMPLVSPTLTFQEPTNPKKVNQMLLCVL
jgi:hypothetical protein